MNITKNEEELLAMLELDTKHLLNELEDMYSIPPVKELRFSLEEWFFKLRDESDEDALAVGMHKLCLALARNSKDKYKPNYDYEIFGLYHATPQQLIIACLLALKEVGNE